MNLVYGLVLYEFSVAQVDRAPARCLGGHMFECCRRFFSLSHAPDMLIISFSQRRFMLGENDWSLPKYFPSKAKWILRRYYFFLAQAIKNSSGQMRQLYAYDANESTRRLVEDGISPAFTNTRTARGFSVVYHVFARKQCILCSALRHKSYLTLP